ncbi:ABC transporter permease [Streptomyces sp. SL13]|jgi:peptide/nickel transport system permease protein|uniref:ABC transporter permease n=1 Tax=Streptantibioticus silvisoli TaxID=2705255 RepID=A0AA90JWD0_9ACTN|nr:ABC transporter permease [Streptantibioticus silvisoli]MDI5966200.1 ABC transporter permease [Streptantibioticus silvisoli]MDI5968951.1 ABC transporter permease [Streptantibioticus silvisoli]
MAGYLIRRLATAIIVVIGITLVTFLMLHIVAPEPALTILGPKATPAAIRAFNHAYGYDRPWYEQFITYLNHLLHGNLGDSPKDNQTVVSLFKEKAPLSAFLSGVSLLVAIVVAIPLGIYQAVKRNSVGDVTATTVAFIFYSMPVFMVALILIQIFALSLGWVDPNVSQDQTLGGALSSWPELVLPIVALATTTVAAYSRYQRSASLDVLAQDYIKVARAKGLPDRLIYTRHLIRNASLPMITLIGLSLPALIAGNVLIENAFNIDGLGLLFVKSLQNDDYNVLLGYTLLTAVLTVIGNLIADVALTLSDPRIRLV